MEKIMSKTNDRSRYELTIEQLDAVSGGIARSIPNGKTDVIKATGNTKWAGDPVVLYHEPIHA